jgi:hypothetical protein
MNAYEFLLAYWWVLLILIFLLFYKFILRVFFGMVIVPKTDRSCYQKIRSRRR